MRAPRLAGHVVATVELVAVGGLAVELVLAGVVAHHVLVAVLVDGELVLGVVPGLLELLLGRLLHVVPEPGLREPGAEPVEADLAGTHTVLVGLGRRREQRIGVASCEDVGLVARDRQVLLGVRTLGGAHDDAGLVAVQQARLVGPLERDAPAASDDEGDHRADEDHHPHEVRDVVQVQVEDHGQDVVAAGQPEQTVRRHEGHEERRPSGGVAWPLEQVVLPLVAGDPRLDERVGQHRSEEQHRDDLSGKHHVPADREAEDLGLPAGHDPEQTFGEAHVPVGLRAGGDLGGVVGAVTPHRVDAEQAAHQRGDAEDDEEVATGLGGVHREHRVADDVLVGAAGAGPLGVLLVHEQQHVQPDEGEQDARDEQHVDDVQARDDHVARELATEHEERHVGAEDGRRLDQAVCDPQASAGEQVVGQRVAGEALDDAEQQEQQTDDVVELARLAERAGEEHSHHVHEHRGDEQHRRPVVHLPHQQAAAYVERDVQGRGVGLGHVQAAELVVGALVDDLGHARLEPERQEGAGEQEHDEAPQRDLTQQERPVVGEDLADLLLRRGGEAGPVVDPAQQAAEGVRPWRRGRLGAVGGCMTHVCHPRSQKLGPTGSVKSL